MLDLLRNYVPWILGLVALLILYQKLAPRLRLRVPGLSLSAEDLLSKLLGPRYAEAKLDKAVARLKKEGNFLTAGKVLEDADKLPEAAEAFLEGNEFWAAASLYEKLGKSERAAELFLQAGDFKKAAQVFVDAGKPTRAAVLFQEKGNNLEAARLYGVGGAWDKAAELYAKSGYPLRAAEAFEKMGQFARAAECHERHFMENVSFSTTYSSTAPSADQKSAVLAGRLYEKAGDLNRAFNIYSKGSYFKEAASVSMKLGDFPRAAELYMRAEDPQSAAQAFDKAGDAVRAANLRGEVAFKTDRMAEAAGHFLQGKDFLRSAELYESVGMLAQAAGAYEAGESFAAAGGVYIRAGLKDKAAASYERAGEFETAAKLYEEIRNASKAIELYGKAGLTFKSGEAAVKAGDREKAIALLQRVPPSDENYRTATELLARLFIESRLPGLAIERVQKALGGQPVSAATLDLCYWLGLAQEASGNAPAALDIYKKIQSEDLQYRDVTKRVARLQSVRAAAPPAAPKPPPVAPAASPSPAATVGTASAAPSPPAAKAPRFATREPIGRGPLGTVYRGEDQVDGRGVALRFLPAEKLQGDGVLQALVRDLKAAAQLSHPNLVKVLGLVELEGKRCLVTELVQGKTFQEALESGRRMSLPQIHSLGRVLAQTLSFVHGKGMIHGSIQPSNIMVASGVVKVADLGLGRLAHGPSSATNYRAPEGRLDVAGDLYAMAAVLYHLLTGVHPKAQPQGVGLPLPSAVVPGVPESLDKLLVRCLHPREDLRLTTADDVLHELKDMVKIG